MDLIHIILIWTGICFAISIFAWGSWSSAMVDVDILKKRIRDLDETLYRNSVQLSDLKFDVFFEKKKSLKSRIEALEKKMKDLNCTHQCKQHCEEE